MCRKTDRHCRGRRRGNMHGRQAGRGQGDGRHCTIKTAHRLRGTPSPLSLPNSQEGRAWRGYLQSIQTSFREEEEGWRGVDLF